MSHAAIAELLDQIFPDQWLKASLVLALFSTWVVISVFAYLNHYTKKSYFSLWTVAWMFYAVWLAASIQLDETPDLPFYIMARRACVGVSALCMFWGSLELIDKARRQRELAYGVVMIVIWSYVAAYKVQDPLWITLPVFVLLASASVYTGLLYLRLRRHCRGANLLTAGFILWGAHLLGYPFIGFMPRFLVGIGYFTSSVLALFIAMGMMVLALEQARERNETLLGEFKKGVTTRRLLEQEISVSDEKYRALFNAASDAILLVDLETVEVLEANDAAKLFLGPTIVEGRRSFLDFCPSLRPESSGLLDHKRAFDEVFRSSNEFHIARPNGAHVLCEGSVTLVRDNRRPVLQINIREITERKKLEQQLRQSEKLTALGQLIAGVAHELNNPLAVIMGYAQILAKRSNGDETLQTDVLKIQRESERAAKIVRNLLTFARPREPQMAPVDLNRLIRNVVETHESEMLQNRIECRQRLAPDLPKTMADPHQIEQVITNLVVNAIQVLTAHEASRVLEITTELSGRSVRICVSDSGPGISPEIVTKIFDPFFTTKAPGKGTGLGLSISHSIVEEHRGKIWVQSEHGKGAKFFVELPVVACGEEPLVVEPPAAAMERNPNAAQYRLLIVDDEPGIVEVLKTVLGENGYTIETATNGGEALDRLDRGRYDLVISDLCMPGVDGETLYKSLQKTDPDLAKRVIFVTGDTVSSNSRAFLEWTGNRWFSKPFDIEEIDRVVGNFLREEPL
ncbi:MAG TPA: ATP-binding protein, partial [Verrucomicrobiae bacterium]|nr:ATP-binding protein [Verrucomicrobiae bacterium]